MKKLHSLKWLNDRMKECQCDPAFLLDVKKVRPRVEKLIRAVGLTLVRRAAYQFDRGYTTVWLFKQSHLSLHSWPEYNFVTLSIEVCSFKGHDDSKIYKLHAGLLRLFGPKHTHPHKLTTNFKRV